MPREACRLFLDVTRVRCERLQDITESDAIAEGFEYCPPLPFEPRNKFAETWNSLYFYPQPIKQRGAIVGYRSFPWDGKPETRTHKGLPWYVVPNPWVFPIDFSVRAT
jgi:hypothetical protein